MGTQDQLDAIADQAEELELLWDEKGARAALREGVEQARGGSNEDYALFFEGWLAHLDSDYPRALDLLARADSARSPFSLRLRLLKLRSRCMQEIAQREVERRMKLDAWRALSARAAHRIGNQVFASRGALRTIKTAQNPELAEAAKDMEGSLDRIQRIVQEFQKFSRNEPPKLVPTDVGAVVKDVVRRYSGVEQGVEVKAEAEAGLPRCLGDPTQLDQALGELLENALHHTPSGGRIRVEVSCIPAQEGRRVRIVVEDTGPGVPTEHKDRIFDAFFSTKPGGSGLGLAIVRQIVQNHKGTIRETGRPGSGARFEIELPALEGQEAHHEGASG